MKKIVVPVDFSHLSRDAMNFAVEFGRMIKGEITLLHVLEYPLSLFNITGTSGSQVIENFYPPEFIDKVRDRLEEWEKGISGKKIPVRSLLKYGNPYQKMSETVAEEDADYIIMGSKGASGLKEIFMGSNAARMIRHSQCPVIIVKGETHLDEIKNIVFATDGTIEQDAMAAKAKELRKQLGLPMYLLKVKTPYNWLEDVQVKQQLENFAIRNDLHDVTIAFTVADFIDEGAVKFAEENDAGLILMGTHGRTGLSHLIGGSTAESTVNESDIPVMVFKL